MQIKLHIHPFSFAFICGEFTFADVPLKSKGCKNLVELKIVDLSIMWQILDNLLTTTLSKTSKKRVYLSPSFSFSFWSFSNKLVTSGYDLCLTWYLAHHDKFYFKI